MEVDLNVQTCGNFTSFFWKSESIEFWTFEYTFIVGSVKPIFGKPEGTNFFFDLTCVGKKILTEFKQKNFKKTDFFAFSHLQLLCSSVILLPLFFKNNFKLQIIVRVFYRLETKFVLRSLFFFLNCDVWMSGGGSILFFFFNEVLKRDHSTPLGKTTKRSVHNHALAGPVDFGVLTWFPTGRWYLDTLPTLGSRLSISLWRTRT